MGVFERLAKGNGELTQEPRGPANPGGRARGRRRQASGGANAHIGPAGDSGRSYARARRPCRGEAGGRLAGRKCPRESRNACLSCGRLTKESKMQEELHKRDQGSSNLVVDGIHHCGFSRGANKSHCPEAQFARFGKLSPKKSNRAFLNYTLRARMWLWMKAAHEFSARSPKIVVTSRRPVP